MFFRPKKALLLADKKIKRTYESLELTTATRLPTAGVGNERPVGHMLPAAAFSVARGSIQKISSNLRFPPA